jgi:hypothetical protein
MRLTDWLFAGPKAAEKILDGTISGIDKIFYTEEERADAKAKVFDQWLKLQEMLGEETSVRGMTRRILAIMFCGVYMLLTIGAAVAWPWAEKYADFLWEIANAQYGWITMSVAIFYFGPYAFEKFFGVKK